MLLTDMKAYGLASASGGRDRYWCLIVGLKISLAKT